MPDYYTFRGEVIPHETYDLSDPNCLAAFKMFERYWLIGFHPQIGLDAPLAKPASIQALAIGHSHLRPLVFQGDEFQRFKKFNPTEQCWDRWANGDYVPGTSAPSRLIPESDEWVVYCVDDNRNACVLGYIPVDAHEECKPSSEYTRKLMEMAAHWFQSEDRYPMPYSDFARLFHADWHQPDR